MQKLLLSTPLPQIFTLAVPALQRVRFSKARSGRICTAGSVDSTMSSALASQSFAGNPMDRSFPDRKKPRFMYDVLDDDPSKVELLLTYGRSICVRQQDSQNSASSSLSWFRQDELSDFGVVQHGGVFTGGGGDDCRADIYTVAKRHVVVVCKRVLLCR